MTRERTRDTGTTYADRVLHEAMVGATRGLDLDRVEGVVTEGIEALAKMVTALRAAEYTPAEYEKTLRSVRTCRRRSMAWSGWRSSPLASPTAGPTRGARGFGR